MLINHMFANDILVQIPRRWGISYYLCTAIYREVDNQYAGTDEPDEEFSHLEITSSIGQYTLEKMWNKNLLTVTIPSGEFIKSFDEAIRQMI